MDDQALEQFLRTIPLFSLVEPTEMPDLLGLVRAQSLERGQTLFQQGAPGDALWVLGEGTEVVVSTLPRGAEAPVVVARAKGGETVGEMALVDEGSRSGSAVVTHEGPAHRIDAADFARLREGFRAAAYKVLKKICLDLCGRLRATDRRIAPEGLVSVAHTPADFGVPVDPALMDDFPPFRKLPQVVKLALANQVRLVETSGIQPLFGEGEPAEAAYFVIEGEVTVGRGGKTFANLGRAPCSGWWRSSTRAPVPPPPWPPAPPACCACPAASSICCSPPATASPSSCWTWWPASSWPTCAAPTSCWPSRRPSPRRLPWTTAQPAAPNENLARSDVLPLDLEIEVDSDF